MIVIPSNTGLGALAGATGAVLFDHDSARGAFAGTGGASRRKPNLKVAGVVHDRTAEPYEGRPVAGDALLFEGALRVAQILRCRGGPQAPVCNNINHHHTSNRYWRPFDNCGYAWCR